MNFYIREGFPSLFSFEVFTSVFNIIKKAIIQQTIDKSINILKQELAEYKKEVRQGK